MPTVHLVPHPTTPCPGVAALAVDIAGNLRDGLNLTYRLAGDLDALQIPAPAASARVDGLWRHTCFEVFAISDKHPGYREFNFSPSGEWAAYAFSGYRDSARDLPMPAPVLACRIEASGLAFTVTLPAAALPPPPLRLGLSAVIEHRDGRIAYWALRHAPGKPDFHHTDAFALEFTP